MLRTLCAMCPDCRERPGGCATEDWEGVTMENGRVVELELEEFGLS